MRTTKVNMKTKEVNMETGKGSWRQLERHSWKVKNFSVCLLFLFEAGGVGFGIRNNQIEQTN